MDTEIALKTEHRAIDRLIGLFAGLDKDGKLPIGSMVYCDKADEGHSMKAMAIVLQNYMRTWKKEMQSASVWLT